MSASALSRGASIGLRPGDVDLSDPKTFLAGVPHEYFRVLREQDPVHWQQECELPVFLPGPGYWALTRYEDVTFVSNHPEIFSSAVGTSSLNERRPRERAMAGDQLMQMDPPGHTELRNVMNVQFKPAAVRETEAHMDTTMRFGEPGVLNLLRARFALLHIFLQSTLLERERRKRPLPDAFSRLLNGEFQGKPLIRLMIQVNFLLLFIAGNETTRNARSGGIQVLCENPDQLERLRRHPNPSLAGPPQRQESNFISGIKHLPLNLA